MLKANSPNSILLWTGCLIAVLAISAWGRGFDTKIAPDPTSQQAPAVGECWPRTYDGLVTDSVAMSADCFGIFGADYHYQNVPNDTGWPTISFASPFPGETDYLFGGAVWIGGIVNGDTLVSTGVSGWSPAGREFYPPDWPSEATVTQLEYVSDYSFCARYVDTFTTGIDDDYFGRPHRPLPIEVSLRGHVWQRDPFQDIVIYDMLVTNIGAEIISDAVIGFYMDCDIGQNFGIVHTDDLAGSLPAEGIAYCVDNDGDLSADWIAEKIFAFKFLSTSFAVTDSSFNWYVSNGTEDFDFGPRQKATPEKPFRDFETGGTGTPSGDVNKYYMMWFDEWDYDQIMAASITPDDPDWLYPDNDPFMSDLSNGADTRFVMSIGRFDLPPGGCERIVFSIFTGDSVHTDPGNVNNLPNDPASYLAGLDFSKVLANAAWADSLADSLLRPENPVIGLSVTDKTDSSVMIQWDGWAFGNVEGYDIYFSEIPLEDLPIEGLIAPWLTPDALNRVAQVDASQTSYTFNDLDPYKIYAVNVANRTTTTVGDPGQTILFRSGQRSAAPVTLDEFLFLRESESITVRWSAPADFVIDHYNIYRFDSVEVLPDVYHAFYDEGCMAETLAPRAIFGLPAEEKTYYYYAMEPLAVVEGAEEYVDYSPVDNSIYLVTAVDQYGYESQFSVEIFAHYIPDKVKDILVIMGSETPLNFVETRYINWFYENLLWGYEYDIYNYSDSVNGCMPSYTCMEWRDLMRYKLVIVDDGLTDQIVSPDYEFSARGFTRYLTSGGHLACFGGLTQFSGFELTDDVNAAVAESTFVARFFGIDSSRYVGAAYCQDAGSLPCDDSVSGFINAEGCHPDWSGVGYDTTRDVFTSALDGLWSGETPPAVVTFIANDNSDASHLFRSLYPDTSPFEGEVVGLTTTDDPWVTYLFGFHLWYMDRLDARTLIETIAGAPVSCCGAMGDFNHDGMADVTDVVAWTYWSFLTGHAPPACEMPPGFYPECDMDGNGRIDIADLIYWVKWSYRGGPQPAPCPQ